MISNSTWVIIDCLLFLYILYLSSIGAKYSPNKGIIPYDGTYYKSIILICLVVFCLYNKTEGDYFHYKELLTETLSTKYPDNHLEWPYLTLIRYIGNNYFLFRLCIWGSGILIIYRLLKINNLANDWGLFCITLIPLISIAYVRACVGIGLFYLGYTYLLKRNFKYIILGICLIIVSTFFHKSIILLLLIGLIIPVVKISQKTLLILIILFPIAVKLLYWGFGDLLLGWGNLTAIKYFNNTNMDYGLGSKIQIYLFVVALIIFLAEYLKKSTKQYKTMSPIENVYLKFIIILFYISFLLSSFEYGVYDLITRVREMAYIPLGLLFASYQQRYKVLSKRVICSLLLFFLSDMSYFLYMFYLKSIGSGI